MSSAFLCIGHRGASGSEPENTLRAFCRALELGADGLELDVRLTQDGVPVVIHDARLRRTTGAPGLVSTTPLEALRHLDAGAGERIPTLREVLDLVGESTLLNIELKGPGTAVATLEAIAVKEAQTPGWGRGHLVLSSFDRRELAIVARANAAAPAHQRIRLGLLLSRRPLNLARLVATLGASSVHLPLWLAGERFILRARALGVRLFVYTVNDPREILRLHGLGVHGVFTDYPEIALATIPRTPGQALFASGPRLP